MGFIKAEWKKILFIMTGFLVFFYLPIGESRFDNSILESLALMKGARCAALGIYKFQSVEQR